MAQVSELATIRCFVEARATALGAGADAVGELALAVDEIVTNTIVHGYAGRTGAIEITVAQAGELPPCKGSSARSGDTQPCRHGLEVRIVDDAPPFDPTGRPAPDLSVPLEQRKPGGLGLHLTRSFTDEMLYCVRPQGGNEIRLVKWMSE